MLNLARASAGMTFVAVFGAEITVTSKKDAAALQKEAKARAAALKL